MGTPWAPPVAVADAIVRKVHKDTPGAPAPEGAQAGAGCIAGSAAYRRSVLTALGLHEAVLSELVAARAVAKRTAAAR